MPSTLVRTTWAPIKANNKDLTNYIKIVLRMNINSIRKPLNNLVKRHPPCPTTLPILAGDEHLILGIMVRSTFISERLRREWWRECVQRTDGGTNRKRYSFVFTLRDPSEADFSLAAKSDCPCPNMVIFWSVMCHPYVWVQWPTDSVYLQNIGRDSFSLPPLKRNPNTTQTQIKPP